MLISRSLPGLSDDLANRRPVDIIVPPLSLMTSSDKELEEDKLGDLPVTFSNRMCSFAFSTWATLTFVVSQATVELS